MLRGKRPFHSSYDSREDSHWGRDTSSLGTSAIIPAVLTYYSRIMLSAYLLFPHYAQCLPIIPALCSMLSGTYYSQNYASIIRPTLVIGHPTYQISTSYIGSSNLSYCPQTVFSPDFPSGYETRPCACALSLI